MPIQGERRLAEQVKLRQDANPTNGSQVLTAALPLGHLTPAADPATVLRLATPRWQVIYPRGLMLGDATAVVVAVTLAQRLRFGESPAYLGISVLIAACWFLALAINHSRSTRVIGSGAEEYRRVWIATFTIFSSIAIASLLFKVQLTRGYLMIAFPVGLVLLLLFRWVGRKSVAYSRAKYAKCITRLIVVGSGPAVRDLTTALAREPSFGFNVVGSCITGSSPDCTADPESFGSVPNFGDETHVVRAVLATGSHAVAVTATEQLDGRKIRDLSWELEKLDIDLLVAPGVIDVAGPRLHMRPVAGLPLIHVEKPQYHGAKQFQKRLFDIGFASLFLIFASPLFLCIYVAIKTTSKGKAFYRQERIGLDGKPFEMIKFRSMVDGADAMIDQLNGLNEVDGGVLFKIREDPRITPVGRFLRKFSLDELPQFINVLKRDMSVVGPRPPLPSEVGAYDDYSRRRLLVRPGITGLWQVSGRSDLSWDDSVRLDLFYVENWSMVADVLIALKTIKAVLSRSGAY